MLLKSLKDKVKKWYRARGLNNPAKTSVLVLMDLFAILLVLGIIKAFIGITAHLDTFFNHWDHSIAFHDVTGDLCYVLALFLCGCGIVVAVRSLFVMTYISGTTVWNSCTSKKFTLKQLSFIAGTMIILVFTVSGMAIDTIGVSWHERGHGFHFRAYMLNTAFLCSILWGWWSTTHYKDLAKCPSEHTHQQGTSVVYNVLKGDNR